MTVAAPAADGTLARAGDLLDAGDLGHLCREHGTASLAVVPLSEALHLVPGSSSAPYELAAVFEHEGRSGTRSSRSSGTPTCSGRGRTPGPVASSRFV